MSVQGPLARPSHISSEGFSMPTTRGKLDISEFQFYDVRIKCLLIQKNRSTPMIIAALFTIAKIWRQPKCPSVDEWIKQLWDIYTMEFYLAIKKQENFTLCNNMDGPGEHYAK